MKRLLIGVVAAVVGLSAFAEYAYIETTGTQAFLTDVCAGPWTRVEMGVEILSAAEQQRLFGADAGDTSVGFSFSCYQNGSGKFAFAAKDGKGNWKATSTSVSTYLNTRLVVALDAVPASPVLTLTKAGETSPISTTSDNQTHTLRATVPMAIGARNKADGVDYFAHVRIYFFRVYENGRLIRCYVPYWNDDKTVVGLKEIMSGKMAEQVGSDDAVLVGGDDPTEVELPDGYRYERENDEIAFHVTASAGTGGTISVGGETGSFFEVWASSASPAVLTATAEEGRVFTGWRDGFGRTESLDAVFVPPFAAASYTAVFEEAGEVAGELPVYPRGLVLDLDSRDRTRVFVDDGGFVTNWTARVGGIAFTNHSNTTLGQHCPRYNDAAFYNRGAVCFGRTDVSVSGTAAYTSTVLRATSVFGKEFQTLCLAMRGMSSPDMTYPFGFVGGTMLSGTSSGAAYYLGGFLTDADYIYKAGTLIWWPKRSVTEGYSQSISLPALSSGSPLPPYTLVSLMTDAQRASIGCSTALLSLGNSQASPAQWFKRGFSGDIGAVLCYAHALEAPERVYLEEYLRDNYLSVPAKCVWTGDGDGTSYCSDANWADGIVPGSNSVAIVKGPRKLVIDGETKVRTFFLDGVTEVEFAENAFYEALRLIVVKGCDAVITVKGGATVTYGQILPWPGASVTLTLDGGTLVANPMAGGSRERSNSQYPVNADFGSVPEAVQVVSTLPGPVTGKGRFEKRGAGLLRLDKAISADVALGVYGGGVDLMGVSQTFAGLSGLGYVSNSVTAKATLTVDESGLGQLPRLCGDIALVKRGEGRLGVVRGAADGLEVSVEGGALAADPGTLPATISSGVTLHLDASSSGSVLTNGRGRVVRWTSMTGNGLVFTDVRDDTGERFRGNGGTFNDTPRYLPDAMNGKPALQFGYTDDGKFNNTYVTALGGNLFDNYRTIACVFWPDKKQVRNGGGTEAYVIGQGHVKGDRGAAVIGYDIDNNGSTGTTYRVRFGDTRIYLNGVKYKDSAAGLTADVGFRPEPQVFILSANPDNYIQGKGSTIMYTHSLLLGTQVNLEGRLYHGLMSEVIAWDHPFTDAEAAEAAAYLLKKWGIAPDEGADLPETESAFSENDDIVLSGGALDLGGQTNALARIAVEGTGGVVRNGRVVPTALDFSVAADGAYPRITGTADWDVTGATLTFLGPQPVSGKAVVTSGTIDGPLAAVVPAKIAPRVKTTSKSIGIPAGLLLFVK